MGFHVASNEPSEPTSSPVAPSPRNANWNWDELILALDLYVKFAGNPPGKASAEVSELSALLNALSTTLASATDYRNHNGVYMKLMNFRRFDPVYQAQGKSGLSWGNKLEEVVWNEFAVDPARLAHTANAIRANIPEPNELIPWPLEMYEAEEGRVLTRAHLVRSAAARSSKRKSAKRSKKGDA